MLFMLIHNIRRSIPLIYFSQFDTFFPDGRSQTIFSVLFILSLQPSIFLFDKFLFGFPLPFFVSNSFAI